MVEASRVQNFVMANANLIGLEKAALLTDHAARIQCWPSPIRDRTWQVCTPSVHTCASSALGGVCVTEGQVTGRALRRGCRSMSRSPGAGRSAIS